MGVVYEAFDRERRMKVALKTLLRVEPGTIYRFKEEFRALVDVAHPNLVSLYELVSVEDRWFFTMELLQGVDFLSYVRGRSVDEPAPEPESPVDADGEDEMSTLATQEGRQLGPQDATVDGGPTVDWDRLRAGLRQLAQGVQALHQSGHLHRDIKPSNVMVTGSGRVVLLDFGVIAELAGSRHPHGEKLELVGTPAYMAPEQALGKITPAADWYSVGVMMYDAMTGGRPFVGSSDAVLKAKQFAEAPPPRLRRPDVPRDLDELCVELLRAEPDRRPTGEQVLRRLGAGRLATSPVPRSGGGGRDLVGREAPLAVLREVFESTKHGLGETVFVHGSSGMGKTALINRFLDEVAEDERAVILSGRCYEREQVPYKGVDAAIDALCRFLLSLPEHEAEALTPRDLLPLAKVFPVLKRVEVFARARRRAVMTPDPHEVRRRAFAALRDLLGRIAERRPLVLFIDDAQWGDHDSAPLLDELMRPPDVPPLLLLVSYRTEDVDSSPLLGGLQLRAGQVDGTAAAREIELGPLAEADARRLAGELLERAGVDAEAAAAVAAESNGHPYFIHELARHAREKGMAGGEELSLEAVIAGRVSRLTPQAQRLLEIVAIAGKPVAQGIAGSAASVAGGELPALVNQLRVAQLVRSAGARDADRIECYHDRIRQTVVERIADEVVLDHHRRLAREYESTAHPDPETLVMHFLAAGDQDAAAEYIVQAAAQAEDALSFERAAELYRLALELRDNSADEERELKAKLGEVLLHAGRGGDAALSFVDAAALSTGTHALELHRRAVEQYLRSGRLDEGMELTRNLVRDVGLRFPATPVRGILGMLFRRAQLRLRGLKFRERSRDQMSAAEIIPVDVCWSVATGLSQIDPARAGVFAARGLLLALKLGDPLRVARATLLETCFQAAQGTRSLKRFNQLFPPTQELAMASGDLPLIALATGLHGFAAFEQGRFRFAHEKCEEALGLLREQTGVPWEIGSMQLFSLVALAYMGDLVLLRRLSPERLASAQQRGDLYTATNIRAVTSPMLAMADGDPERAVREAEAAIAGWPTTHGFHNQHFMALALGAQADLQRGDAARAYRRWTEAARPLKDSMLLFVQIIRGWTLYGQAMAALAAARQGGGLIDERHALELAQRNARKLEKEGVDWTTGFGKLVRASAARARGDDEAAAAALRLAVDSFEKCAMLLHAASARRALGRLLGGTAGDALIQISDEWARNQQCRDLDRVTAAVVALMPE